MSALNPSYKLPSRFAISRTLLVNKYEDACTKMKATLASVEHVTLTTDMWTSNNTESFVAVTAHFITKDWKLQSVLLDCGRFIGAHTHVEIQHSILDICRTYGIDRKIHAIMTDNAANIKLAVDKLGFSHLSCMAHTTNLVVKDAIKVIGPLRTKLKAIVEYFHRSTSGSDMFKQQQKSFIMQQRAEEKQRLAEERKRRAENENAASTPAGAVHLDEAEDDVVVVEPVAGAVVAPAVDEVAEADEKDFETDGKGITTYKLINDVETRWNPTFHMFERICKLRKPLVATIAVLKDKKVNLPTLEADDFTMLEEACVFLAPFYRVTVELSAEKNVSGSKVVILIRQLMKSVKAGMKKKGLNAVSMSLGTQLLSGLTTRYKRVEHELLLSTAAFLDPRFKKYGVIDSEAYKACKDHVHSKIVAMVHDENFDRELPPVTEIPEDDDPLWGQFDRQFAAHHATPTSSATIELRQYGEEPQIDRQLDDPLEWWRSREVVYPRIAKLARKYLSLVATSVPSERVFSTAGEVLSKKRNRLSSDNVQRIVVLHGNQTLFET